MNKIKQEIKKRMPKPLFDLYELFRDNILIKRGYDQVRKSRIVRTQKNAKMRIVFIVQRTEVFNSVRTVFNAAAASDQCDVYLLPIPRRALRQREPDWETYPATIAFCQKLGVGTVIDAYDPGTQTYFNLEQIKPDYIFLNVPYTGDYPKPYAIQNLARIAKVCYVPYGYNLSESILPVEYPFTNLGRIDFLFLAGDPACSYCKKRMWLSAKVHGNRVFDIGYPKLDLLEKNTQSDPKTVLYLPRWTVNHGLQSKNEQSSFLWVYPKLIEFASRHPDVDFIIRPHPLMFQNFQAEGILTPQEVAAIYDSVSNHANLFLDSSPDYWETLGKTDILLADYTSMLMEFFPLGKPIIYLGSEGPFAKYNRYLYESFYHLGKWAQIESCIDGLLLGVDPKREIRSTGVDQVMSKCDGNAGIRILNTLLDDYQESIL